MMADDGRSYARRPFRRRVASFATLSLLCLLVASAIAPAIGATGGATFSSRYPEFPDTEGGGHYGDREVTKVFGQTRYSVPACTKVLRVVRIDVERLNKEFDIAYGGNIFSVAHEVLRRAILFAWRNCSVDRNGDPYFIDSASVYLPSGEEIYSAYGLRNNLGRPGPFYGKNLYVVYFWSNFRDIRAEESGARYERERNEWWESFWFNLKVLFYVVLCAPFLGLALWNWEAFARLYYQLTPHPAASMVKDAIRARVEFDAQAFADIVRDLPDSRVGRDVRNAQAETLTKMARMSNEQLRRIADELRHQFEEQAKYQAAHGERLDEVAEQLAKARADTYAKAQEFWNSRRKP